MFAGRLRDGEALPLLHPALGCTATPPPVVVLALFVPPAPLGPVLVSLLPPPTPVLVVVPADVVPCPVLPAPVVVVGRPPVVDEAVPTALVVEGPALVALVDEFVPDPVAVEPALVVEGPVVVLSSDADVASAPSSELQPQGDAKSARRTGDV